MSLVPLSELFDVVYGNKFDLCSMQLSCDEASVNFVSRTGNDNGVSAKVARVVGVAPYQPGSISVALGGAILSSFVQTGAFYTGQNVAVLTPKTQLSLGHLLYYCAAIQQNKFRYAAFGREANRTLRSLLVPDLLEVPEWAESALPAEVARFDAELKRQGEVHRSTLASAATTGTSSEQEFVRVSDIFEVLPGTSLELNALDQVDGGVPFVARSAKNNGVTAYIAPPKGIAPIPAGVLSVALGGSPMSTFLQEEPFYCGRDVSYLVPRVPMSRAVLLYYAACLRANRYRFCFGRQANRSLANLMIPTLAAVPAWVEPGLAAAVGQLRTSLALSGAAEVQ